MREHRGQLGVMIRMTLWLALCSLLSTGVAHASDERPVIFAFGDSLTAGYNLPEGLGYAPQLEDALRREGIAATVIDGGLNGDTTSAGRERLTYVLDGMDEMPDLVLLELGGNDVLRAIDPAITRANLAAMIEELQRRNLDVLLIGMRAPQNYDPDYVKAFDAIYPALAARYGIPLYPFFLEGLIGVEGTVMPDGIHPTYKGIKIMVSGTKSAVIDALRD